MLSIIDIIEDTTVDGPGFRTAIYAAGCPNACPGCHNPESWDIKKGKQISTEEILTKVLADDFANVTFSGGDPMFQPEGFTKLAQAIKERAPYIAPGTWPDADMLPLGKISIRGERGEERWTNFTRDEQYTMMNL